MRLSKNLVWGAWWNVVFTPEQHQHQRYPSILMGRLYTYPRSSAVLQLCRSSPGFLTPLPPCPPATQLQLVLTQNSLSASFKMSSFVLQHLSMHHCINALGTKSIKSWGLENPFDFSCTCWFPRWWTYWTVPTCANFNLTLCAAPTWYAW